MEKMTKAQYAEYLIQKVNAAIQSGKSAEDAIGVLSEKQYDFLIDRGIDFDALLLTKEQLATVQEVKRADRPKFDKGYNKKYPQSKQDLYNSIVGFIESQGAEVMPREKQNFRDLDFTLAGKHYRIVLSEPRT